ncbi:endonuclease domain-containing protein [Bifidobacterium goeldii]|nr:hypothetical protein [Bifidobacterium goeldii]
MDQLTLTGTLAERKRDVTQRCAQASARVGGNPILFGMTTALELQEIALPTRYSASDTVLHTVASTPSRRIVTVDGTLCAHVWKPISTDATAVVYINRTVCALHPFHVWAQLARHLALDELITLGDSVLSACAQPPSVLAEFINKIRGFAGRTACLQALPHIRAGVASPMESRARLAVTQHGIPNPEINYIVRGEKFASGANMTLDLAWPHCRVAVEYDGDHHRTDKTQWRRDQEKRERLRSHGWIVIIITADDLCDNAHRAEFAFRVARYLIERGAQFQFHPVATPLESKVPHSRLITL